MKTKRSKIASDILKLVKIYFEGPEFKDRPDKVKDYILWALQAGGPVYYEYPVLKLAVLKKGNPAYLVSVS
jgi:hypothetical protein